MNLFFWKIPVFDLKTCQWREVATNGDDSQMLKHPGRRRCHDLVQIKNFVYIIGGYKKKYIYDDLWILNLENLQWKKVPQTMPLPVYFHSASVSVHGEMIIFGGVTKSNHSERTNELFSIWLNLPPLKEICWLAVLKLMENNKLNKNLHDHFMTRIPPNYLKRLFLWNTIFEKQKFLGKNWGKIGGKSRKIWENNRFRSLEVDTERTNELFSIWLNLPPLKEICWMAVLKLMENNKLNKTLHDHFMTRIPPNYLKDYFCETKKLRVYCFFSIKISKAFNLLLSIF